MTDENCPLLIVILGPTATGKTRFAAQLAARINGEIISADSRQVYRQMNLGTGKDYDDYLVDGQLIASHLIDIADPGTDYDVFQFQRDFIKAFHQITGKGKIPVLCGGTGMYIEAVLSRYQLVEVPENQKLRDELNVLQLNDLQDLLRVYPHHNSTDLLDRNRLIRALEIHRFKEDHPETQIELPRFRPVILGIMLSREEIRTRITDRLKKRLDSGMIEEVRILTAQGVSHEKLEYYGLEYKYISQYLAGRISYDVMFSLLNTAIHQFAKRQMTWFRRMEKKGIEINWIDGNQDFEESYQFVIEKIKKSR